MIDDAKQGFVRTRMKMPTEQSHLLHADLQIIAGIVAGGGGGAGGEEHARHYTMSPHLRPAATHLVECCMKAVSAWYANGSKSVTTSQNCTYFSQLCSSSHPDP